MSGRVTSVAAGGDEGNLLSVTPPNSGDMASSIPRGRWDRNAPEIPYKEEVLENGLCRKWRYLDQEGDGPELFFELHHKIPVSPGTYLYPAGTPRGRVVGKCLVVC